MDYKILHQVVFRNYSNICSHIVMYGLSPYELLNQLSFDDIVAVTEQIYCEKKGFTKGV